MIEYCLIPSRRKTLAIQITPQGELVVRCPIGMEKERIEAFLREKMDWILEKQAEARKRSEAFSQALQPGGSVPYLGGKLEVAFYGERIPIRYLQTLYLPQSNPVDGFFLWRSQEARALLLPMVTEWSIRTRCYPLDISFGNAAGRWGSMNQQGFLRLNNALVQLPLEQIQYVIVHELCHMLFMDHSADFHRVVRFFLPEADRIRKEMSRGLPPFIPQ